MAIYETKGRIAVRQAYSSSDLLVLAATFLVFFMMSGAYFFISYFVGDEFAMSDQDSLSIILGLSAAFIWSVVAFAAVLLIGMFLVRMQRQMMLGNALQIEYSDYAWLREWANEVAADLEMPRVEVFVTQDPVINAYAFGFIKPYTIVLHSGSIRYLTHDELKVIIVHEMGHIKFGHTHVGVYMSPFLTVPIISVLGTWIAGFWQRRTELTCDRLALMYMGDSELVKRALIKVYIGPDVAKAMNETARRWQQYNAERPMNRLAQTFSTHPFLVRRLSHIDKWKSYVEPSVTAPATVVQVAEQ